jgi:exopolysaccharide production protein ExoQ
LGGHSIIENSIAEPVAEPGSITLAPLSVARSKTSNALNQQYHISSGAILFKRRGIQYGQHKVAMLMHPGELGQSRFSALMIDKCALVPLAACAFAVIIFPLLDFFNPSSQEEVASGVARLENRIFWPAMVAISVVLVAKNRPRLAKLTWPPHIICLLAFLAFAGASVLWAFRPESSLIRFVQQVMVVTSCVLPAMLAARTADIMRGLFLCFVLALFLNIPFVISGTATVINNGVTLVDIGCPGYFAGKNYLGECAAIGFLLSLYEMIYRGRRRVLGIIGGVIAIYLVYVSNSKTALGLAFVAPFLAGIVLIARKITGISLAFILLSIPLCYVVLSSVSHYNMNLLSYKVYGDATFTGRTIIWDFVQNEIDRRPFLGWGYESFWLVPGSPVFSDAGGWVRQMPNGHNGYYDTMLDMGYLGLAFLLVFISATLHAVGRVADRDPARAWLVLSLALYVLIYNFLESLLMRGFEFEWLVFLILAAEIGRYWQPLPLRRAAYRSRSSRAGSPGHLARPADAPAA